MYEHLSVEELYDMGREYVLQAHGVLPKWNAASGAEKTAAREEMDGLMRKAADCFKASATRGHLDSHYEMALLLDTVQVPETAFGWALRAAELGHGEACDFVARAYAEGRGVSQDAKQAEYWNKQAVKNHSSGKTGYVLEKVAAEMKQKERDVGFYGIVLLVLEVFSFFISPLLSTLLVSLDMVFFDSWEYKMLRGYYDNEKMSLLSIRHFLDKKVHLGCALLTSFFNFLYTLIWGAALVMGYKMREKTVGSLPRWNDPASWNWEKYAENDAG